MLDPLGDLSSLSFASCPVPLGLRLLPSQSLPSLDPLAKERSKQPQKVPFRAAAPRPGQARPTTAPGPSLPGQQPPGSRPQGHMLCGSFPSVCSRGRECVEHPPQVSCLVGAATAVRHEAIHAEGLLISPGYVFSKRYCTFYLDLMRTDILIRG